MSKKAKSYFIKDESINDMSFDKFNHTDISKIIENIIDSTQPPYNIAVIGKWGMGKSSLIKMALNKYKDNNNFCVIDEINA